MTNTKNNHPYQTSIVIRLADVRLSTVVAVVAGAIEPLAGRPEIVSMGSETTQQGHRLAEVTWTFFALNDNEAQRTVRVMRAAMSELVTGSTILSVGGVA